MNKPLTAMCAAIALTSLFTQVSPASNISSPGTTVSQGYSQLAHGAPGTAAKTFSKVLMAEPNNMIARRYLAHALTQCGQYQAATLQFQQLSKYTSLEAVDLSQWATAYLQLGNHQLALNYYNQALRLDPKFGPALVGLVRTHLAMSNKSRALAICEIAITQASDSHSQEQIRRLMEQVNADKNKEVEVQGETEPG